MDGIVNEVGLVWSMVRDQQIRVSFYCLHCRVYEILYCRFWNGNRCDGVDLEVKMRVGKGGAASLDDVDQWHCSPRI